MEFQGISDLKEGFSQLQNFNQEENSREISNDIGKEKTESLKKLVLEINALISERQVLSNEIFAEAEKIKTEINNFLFENEAVKPSEIERDSIREKGDLRHKKIEISELQLNEKISCWKDIALLKKELRLYEKELSERESRMDMLNKLMAEEN